MRTKSTSVCIACGTSFLHDACTPRKYCSKTCANRHKAYPSRGPEEATRMFWSHVDVSSDQDSCWHWNGCRDRKGYGQFRWNGRNMLVHRISWEIANGPIPDGLGVLHHCDNPRCIRPDHLFVGTQSDNMQDCADKRRTTKGERNTRAVLTQSQVDEIRRRYIPRDPINGRHGLAKEFGVSHDTIYLVATGRTWT